MKKNKLGLLGWFGIFLVLGGIGGISEKEIIAGIISILIGGFLIFLKMPKSTKKEKVLKNEPEIIAKTENDVIYSDINIINSDDEDNEESEWDYEYTDVGIYRPKGAVGPMPNVGDSVVLMLDPNNPYDSDAVKAVSTENGELITVGYMNKGKLRDMVTDFINRDNDIFTEVTRADSKLEIWIGMNK